MVRGVEARGVEAVQVSTRTAPAASTACAAVAIWVATRAGLAVEVDDPADVAEQRQLVRGESAAHGRLELVLAELERAGAWAGQRRDVVAARRAHWRVRRAVVRVDEVARVDAARGDEREHGEEGGVEHASAVVEVDVDLGELDVGPRVLVDGAGAATPACGVEHAPTQLQSVLTLRRAGRLVQGVVLRAGAHACMRGVDADDRASLQRRLTRRVAKAPAAVLWSELAAHGEAVSH